MSQGLASKPSRISGPIGVGKTTIGNEISLLLKRRGVPHTMVDLDVPAATHPRPPDDRFGSRLALTSLSDVWANCAAAGSRNLIVARVIETQQDLTEIQRCAPGSEALVCQLRADQRTLMHRVNTREPGSGRDWHTARALDLSRTLQATAPADFTVYAEGRSPSDIAEEIAAAVAWAGGG